jgi:UDP-2,4-diacetamido-2,4,6-trideoxy-beta-L-altropyranose hydrolase
MSKKSTIFFRVDASVLIGSGHVMRCLTLAEELRQAGADVRFIPRSHDGSLNSLIQNKGFKLYELPTPCRVPLKETTRGEYATWLGTTQEADAAETVAILKTFQPDCLIVDHYAIDETWEQLVRPYVNKIIVIDDLADRKHDCDLLLDQNYVHGGHKRYTDLVSPACTVLAGPKYALLRKEFAEARKNLKHRDGSVYRVFVFFGGVDSDNMTGKALEALSANEVSHIHVDVVIGAANPHRAAISHVVTQRSLTILHVQVENIAELMAQADLAICAGGTTTWERFCLGLPSLVVSIADNQVPFTRDLHQDGLLRWLGTSQDVDVQKLREGISQALQATDRNRQETEMGMKLVDGSGAQKLAHMLLKGPLHEELRVRRVIESDCELFWHWANDPEVRKNAFNSDLIPSESHKIWFSKKIRDPYTTIYVLEYEQCPIGHVRFEINDEQYVISYLLGRTFRGIGMGKKILKIAIDSFKKTRLFLLKAEVKCDNFASAVNFIRLGFKEQNHEINKRVFKLDLREFLYL